MTTAGLRNSLCRTGAVHRQRRIDADGAAVSTRRQAGDHESRGLEPVAEDGIGTAPGDVPSRDSVEQSRRLI